MNSMVPRAILGLVDPRQWGGALAGSLGTRLDLWLPSLGAGSGRSRDDNAGLPHSLGRAGALEVRLARSAKEVRLAQKLRFSVFYEEMSARPDLAAILSRRDRDAYDGICDHLLVLDHGPTQGGARPGPPRVVGTYRLLREEVARRQGGFYSASEFDIGALMAARPGRRFLELGRSCVLPAYRNRKTVELLWHGIWTYVLHHRVDVMIGCASLAGTDPSRLALPLSFLCHHAGAPADFTARALPGRYVSMDRIAREAVDVKAALQMLPPLLKGYLRLGATFGDGAVIDQQFGTTDVLVILPVERISGRYVGYFGPGGERYAA
jgi:putative hemolysin